MENRPKKSVRKNLTDDRLLKAQRLEIAGALAVGIAHDFNNILATISGYAQMLQEDLQADSESAEKAGRIRGAVLKAQSIINKINAFTSQSEEEIIPVSVSDILIESMEFVRSSIPTNIVVEKHIPIKKIKVLADPTQLFRVFLNLITNAIQSMELTGGRITVNMEILKGEIIKQQLNKNSVAEEYVLLTFKDTGSGMEPAEMTRIFEPFFTTRKTDKGTGLGLSVVHGIITEMKGEIVVSSKKGKGSVFSVYLPLLK